jgi:hypothetical protein
MAGKLTTLFLDQFKAKSPTVEGLAHTTRRHLTTAFTASVNSKGASQPSVLTPSNNSSTPRIVSARSSSYSIDADADADADVNSNTERLDERLVPFSSTLRGAHRLRIIDILQLKVGQQVTIVIPSEPKERDPAKSHRSGLMDLMKSAIRDVLDPAVLSADRDDYVDHDLSLRTIEREGRLYHEFNVTISSYAERHRLEDPIIRESEVDYLLNPQLRAGLSIRLDGYANRTRGIMLQFLAIPYIEVFVERGARESILDPRIEMPRTTKDEVVSAHMADEFKFAKGDPIATIDVMMKGYNTQYKNAKKDLVKLVKSIENIAAAARDATDDDRDEAEDHAHAIVVTAIRNETQNSNITEFAALVDNKYRQKLEQCVDWSVATSYLLSDNDIMELYNEFQRRFPLVHMTLSAIVSTRYYSVPLSLFNIER